MDLCKRFVPGLLAASISSLTLAESSTQASATQLLFGDTHLHTSYSFDAYLNKNQTADPDTAYRWAKGLPVIHPYNRARVQIETPLDFLVVADHAELMGVIRAVNNETAELEDMGLWGNFKRWLAVRILNRAIDNESGSDVFNSILPRKPEANTPDPVQNPDNELPLPAFGDTLKTETTAWHEIVDAAERHNEPGTFTTFHGWEWSSIPVGANLHRIVFTPDTAEQSKQFVPYGSDQSQYPEDLWTWLEETQARTGSRFVAIPHNSNISKGFMYAETTLRGEEITPEYAKRRLKWEPVSEVTQIKGDSETHPQLSPDDEFADFETYSYYIQQSAEDYRVAPGDYMRSGLKAGLSIEESIGTNPYQFGVIGSTDSHSGLASAEEDNFWGKFARDSTPETKVSKDKIGGSSNTGWSMSSSGLAAVWATENTREAIFAAFQRKEVYATTGTRLRVRVFAGWDFPDNLLSSEKFAEEAYQLGVPMGGTLTSNPLTESEASAPQLLIQAQKDPNNANLDRIQVVKGWIDAQGQQQEKIYNVAWSDDRQLDEQGKLPPVGNTVNQDTAHYTNSIGAPTLSAHWQDPDFEVSQRAFYYVRVLQIPTPRHSLYDAVALQAPAEGPTTIQERAYTSAIWYKP